MTIIRTIKKTLGYVIADSIITDIQSNRSKYYYFLGKSVPTIPNQVLEVDSSQFEAQTRNEIALMRRITSSDVCTVLPRIDWIPNTVFEMYSSTESPEVVQYYCVNSNYSVYKCLDNNNGSPSTIEPTSIGSDSFYLNDGYRWKFLYNIPLALRNKFVTGEYIPVIKSLSGNFFSDGSIESFNIINHGSGYTRDTTSIVVNGNGEGALVEPVIVDGQIVDIIIHSSGVGYTFANIEVESTRNVTSQAVITANLSIGDVKTPQALVEMLTVPGTIESFNIENSGSGYTSASIVFEGDGVGAEATVNVVGGRIERIIVNNIGSGYTYCNVRIDGDGVGAIITANVSPPFGHGRNAILELNSNMVMFYQNLAKQTAGTVSIDNDFSQYGIIRNPLNKNLGTNISDQVSKDTYSIKCNFSTGSSLSDFTIGSSVYIIKDQEQKVFEIIYTVSGISGVGMMLKGNQAEIESAATVFSLNNPLKSFQVVTSEKQLLVDSSFINCSYIISGATDVSLFPDDVIVVKQSSGKQFRVISSNASNNKMLLMPLDNGTINVGDIINKKDSLINFTVSEAIDPNIDRKTGDILFIENRDPINQTEDQSVTFRTVLKF